MIIDSSLERKLLVVPFNDDYFVNDNVKALLTDEVFFEECFLKPDFNKQIQEIKSLTSMEIPAFDVDLSVSELIEKYNSFNEDLKNLYNWIETNQNELFCIKGDAGTGKSTFLHYLKYKYRDSDIAWNIIDIQKAIKKVSILGHGIEFSDFSNLYCKSVSAIIFNLKYELFVYEGKELIDYYSSKEIIFNLMNGYNTCFDRIIPDEKVVEFFNETSEIIKTELDEKIICNEFAKLIKKYVEKIFSLYKDDYSELFSIILEWFTCIIISLDNSKRHIISFDNFERFIGTDEIYSYQLTQFVSELRNTQNQLTDNLPALASCFQIIIFMRNTSTRMFTPQQVAEITAHSLDISEWFHSSKIIEKKIDWYNENGIDIDGADIIKEILHDIGGGDNCVRGLRTKLNMIFNYNKRVIVKFLIKVISDSANEEYLKKYKEFWNNKNKDNYNLDYSLSRFVARMIIFRLILNRLRHDDFFKNIIVQKSKDELYCLGYARKILTILYDYKLKNEKNPYMNFTDILTLLFKRNDSVNMYFDSNNELERDTISQILFYMNYYNVRSNNWLQFIDIQYNMSKKNISIESYNELEKLLSSDYKNVKIRITNAGIAYLYFVVSSFEYFACKCIYSFEKKHIFGDSDLPPIMAVIPNSTEILFTKTQDITCLKVIKAVYSEASLCLKKLSESENCVDFRYDDKSLYVCHKKRIINSHVGFLGNYKYCIKEVNLHNYNSNPLFTRKLNSLLDEIDEIMNKYKNFE